MVNSLDAERECNCGPMPGYFCGSRIYDVVPEAPAYFYLSGWGCYPHVQYYCTQNGQPASLVRVCPGAGDDRCTESYPGNDHCTGFPTVLFNRKLSNN